MMELRRLSVAAIMGECRKVGKSSRSTVFTGALALTLIGCFVFLAFLTYPSSPIPIPIPMAVGTEHRHSWRPFFLRDDQHHDETSANSKSGSFLSLFIPTASGSPPTPSSSADLLRHPPSGANATQTQAQEAAHGYLPGHPDLVLSDTSGVGSNRSSHSHSHSQSQSQSRPQNRTENAHAESASHSETELKAKAAGKGLYLSKNVTSKLNSSKTGAPPAEQGSGKVEQRDAAAGADLNISGGNSAETKPYDEEKKKKNKGKNKERGSGELQPVSAASNVSSAAPKQQQNKTNEAVAVEKEQKNKKKEEQEEKKNRNESVVVLPTATTMMKKCDLFDGKWVPDNSRPLYPGGSCPHIDESFNCFRSRRPDNLYERWRWQPHDCTIPRLNATDMLERMRNKRLMFVGDSLNRNMWESLVCILRDSVSNKTRVYEISGKKQFRTEGFYAFRYEDYNCSVEFVRAPFLVQEWEVDEGNGTKKETLRLDLIESSFPKVKEADIVIFNTGHWWTHEKTSKGQDYYQEGDHVYPELNVLEAYRKALKTWARWVEANIDFNKTTVFFRGYSATHFSGGQWNSGGQCHKEIEPIYNETYITKYPPKMEVLESVLKEMKNEVLYLNITRMTDYRKDAHPSIYRREYLSQEERIKSERYQDCSHWCLPGVPDIWNEVVYGWLLRTGKGSWKT